EGYARGRESELAADIYAARSLMPPSTALHRSFRSLAAEIPKLHAEQCVGCMECVNLCPDTAILARVAEPEMVQASLDALERPGSNEWMRGLFTKTTKYYDLPLKRGEAGGLFGIFVDPDKCKGCGECVTACGTHHALEMAQKSTVDLAEYDAGIELFRKLPPT